MQNNRNIQVIVEQPLLDVDDWEIALQPYGDNPDAALNLGICLMMLKSHIGDRPRKINEAIEELDRALMALFLYSHFHEASYVLFRRMTQGKISLEEQNMLTSLGVKL